MVKHTYQLHREIDHSLLKTLQDQMFTSAYLYVDELAINCRDASATTANIEYDPIGDSFIIFDDGNGMGKEEVKYFFTPGGSSKRDGQRTKKGKQQIGKFGMAKACMLKIGQHLILDTVRGGAASKVEMDLEELMNVNCDPIIHVDDADPELHGTSITITGLKQQFKNRFDPEKYRKEVGWRLPIDEDFGLVIDNRRAQPRCMPNEATAKRFPVNFSYYSHDLRKQCFVVGNMYVTHSPRPDISGLHLYVDDRRAFNHQHDKFPRLELQKAGMKQHIVIAVEATDLRKDVLFTRNTLNEESDDVQSVMEGLQNSLAVARSYMESPSYPGRKKIFIPSAPSRVDLPAAAPPLARVPPAAEQTKVIPTRVYDSDEALFHGVLQQFIRAKIPEVPKDSKLMQHADGTSAIVCDDTGRFFYNPQHPAVAWAYNPGEREGRIVAAFAHAIGKLRSKRAGNLSLDTTVNQIWRSLPGYSTQERLASSTSTATIDPSKEYTVEQLANMSGSAESRIRYILPALIGEPYNGPKRQLIEGDEYLHLMKKSRGSLPLIDVMTRVSSKRTVPLISVMQSVFDTVNYEPYIKNHSVGEGSAYFIDRACTNVFVQILEPEKTKIFQEAASDSATHRLAGYLRKVINNRLNGPFTTEQLKAAGEDDSDVDNIIEFGFRIGLMRAGNAGKGFNLREYVLAAQAYRAK